MRIALHKARKTVLLLCQTARQVSQTLKRGRFLEITEKGPSSYLVRHWLALSQSGRFLVLGALCLMLLAGWEITTLPSRPTSEAISPQMVSAQPSIKAADEQRPVETAKLAQTTSRQDRPNFLSTSGSKIVDADGHEVRLTGVNWFGMETGTFSPHGLWARNWQDMLDQVVAAGYNTIRLPYSSQIFDPNARPMEGIDYRLNPDLVGLNGLQIMDKIVEGAGRRGIKIILDRHRPNTEAQSKLWYTDFLPEEQWIADWQTLAKRYLGNDTIVGADLHNEPAGDAKWGSGDAKDDWRAAAERAGNAILSVNPQWLIIVEGVEKIDKDWYWMGGNLRSAGSAPVHLAVPNKLVYSAHDYGPGVYDQDWFKDRRFPDNLPEVWDEHWGYLVKQNIAPVLMGEFGGKSVDPKDREGLWQRALLKYLNDNAISFTYWSLNPNSGDTGGILQDDWQSLNQAKQDMLQPFLRPRLAVLKPDAIDRTAVATTARKNSLPAQPIRVQSATAQTDAQVSELSLKITILNQTAANVPLEDVDLRYWLSPDVDGPSWAAATKPVVWTGKQAVSNGLVSLEKASVDGTVVRLTPSGKGNPLPFLEIGFGKASGTVPSWGKVELEIKVKRPDRSKFVQTDQFSYKASDKLSDNDAIALYFWGQRIWGNEPTASPASTDKR